MLSRSPAQPPPLICWWQLRIELLEVTPTVWRRVLIPENITLPALHQVLRICLSWTDSHLHEFGIGGKRYAIPDPDWVDDLKRLDERRVTLSKALPYHSRCFDYLYDFGDDWYHIIVVEDPYAGHAGQDLHIRCLAGENHCPSEDMGGPHAYQEFLKAIADPKHEDHDQYLTWIGGSFDPRHFDLAAANSALQHKEALTVNAVQGGAGRTLTMRPQRVTVMARSWKGYSSTGKPL